MSDSATLIVGAGIGGLTLALSLARRGHSVRLFERAQKLEETGAGVQLSPNASRILDGLGLGPALDAAATRPEAVSIVDGLSGRELKRLPLGIAAERRWGAPYRVIHRADLQSILRDAVLAEPAAALGLGSEVRTVRETGTGVALDFVRDGAEETVEGARLVGADGLRSVMRTAVKLPPHVRKTGLKAWRTVLPAGALSSRFSVADVAVWLGPSAHFVVYPVRGGREANLVLIGSEAVASPETMVARFAPPARAIVAAAQSWTEWPLADRDPDARMHRGRIALLGDAAHAALPSLAQGAAFAIEDAATLARLIVESGPDPFEAYEKTRLVRVARMQMRARRQIQIDHLSGVAALARNAALMATPAGVLLSGLDWIYSWRDR
ncbi:FAD-dependent monooxygenase [Hansschlegelia quercus]|uniref:FAD-binding protein n=1 Tax=Hansschlegelia quercus TaxID=2528245 RepID=A0A4V2JEC0_9HYPH|nr:FAD-dependent monooxygenase [Hansschlegelia quercus]TBN54656.1 FAD-binding protein [Hansschlegelia quercus]